MPEFLFFWGHHRKRLGDKAVFSQWYPSTFVHDGVSFPTAEHWMMYQKAMLFEDQEIADAILDNPYPGEVKEWGRKVRGFSERKWNTYKRDIVFQGNILKFSQNSELEDILIGTDDKILVEASPYDKIWGIGMREGNKAAKMPAEWRGENLLGFVLMDVREALWPTEKFKLHKGPGTWQIKKFSDA